MKNKELKDLLSLVLGVANAVVAAERDGKIDMGDIGLLIGLVPKVGPAIEGVGEIPSELAAMQPEDAADIALFVASQLALDNEKAKAIIDKSLQTIVAVMGLVKAIKS